MDKHQFVIGVDYGTDSVRSVIVESATGTEIASSVFAYPRWKNGLYCDAQINQFRQHPLDYVEGLEHTITDCIKKAGANFNSADIKGVSIDTTGSTPVAVDKQGVPLALIPGFESNPNAMFVLWKDHTAVQEAEAINAHALNFETNYLKFVGGIYSSEWFWAKLLHILKTDKDIAKACYSWVEHCDWITFLITGRQHVNEMKRSRCAAGHKALWADDFGGLPPDVFFSSLDPLLEGFTERLYKQTYTSDVPAGNLSPEWAARLGLSTSVVVGVGAFDAHMGAVGGQIEPYHLSKVMGTSTCDILVAPAREMEGKLVQGICGQVDGSVIPGMVGLEAGQSAFGDTYAWFKNLILWPIDNLLSDSKVIDGRVAESLKAEMSDRIIAQLSAHAAQLPVTVESELAVDWLNGRRTPDADQMLKAAIAGLSLGTDAPRMFRALAEATCFGAKSITDRFVSEGIPVKGIIGIGGVAKRSPFIMQMMADVLGMPIRVHQFEHTCALGAAMFASVAAGLHATIENAMKVMGTGFDVTYFPDTLKNAVYQLRYKRYQQLGRFVSREKESSPVNQLPIEVQ